MPVLLIAVALMLNACGSSARQDASVTVKLPPPRPYVPAPAFSFGAAPRQPH